MGTTTVRIGPEYDDQAVNAAKQALIRIGAVKAGGSWRVVGSQEFSYEDWSLGGAMLRLEAETYVGVTLTGPEDAIEHVVLIMGERPRT